MKRRALILMAAVTITGAAGFAALAGGNATGQPAGVYTIAAPTLVQVQASTHNSESSRGCGTPVTPTVGSEFDGTIENGAGSYLGPLHVPQGSVVTTFKLIAHDFTTPGNVFAFLARKAVVSQADLNGGYNVLASVQSKGAVNSVRVFTTKSIHHGAIDNGSFAYFVEVVNCDSTIEPIALQIAYT
jgi:hypothetical protein